MAYDPVSCFLGNPLSFSRDINDALLTPFYGLDPYYPIRFEYGVVRLNFLEDYFIFMILTKRWEC